MTWPSDSGEIHLHYLNHPDVQALALSDAEIVAAVEQALLAQGRGETTIEPRMHLVPEKDGSGHFNVLRGYIRPLALAGVKVVGDFYRNYEVGLPSELALLNLFDPTTGVPIAVIDASDITDMRTGAVTAIGARELARQRFEGARPHRRARHGVLERAPAAFDLRLRRDPRPFAEKGKPRRVRRAAARRTFRARTSSSPTTGSRACAAPTSSSRRRVSRSPSRS